MSVCLHRKFRKAHGSSHASVLLITTLLLADVLVTVAPSSSCFHITVILELFCLIVLLLAILVFSSSTAR